MKIGEYKDFFKLKNNEINRFLISAIFDQKDFQDRGSDKFTDDDIKKMFIDKKLLSKDLHTILIVYEKFDVGIGMLAVTLGKKKKTNSGTDILINKHTFAIDLKTLNVYDTKYYNF
jgi:hypothetical protein